MTRRAKRKFWQDTAGVTLIVGALVIAGWFFYSQASHAHSVGAECAAHSINPNGFDRCLAENM